jgi:hypothetical protein
MQNGLSMLDGLKEQIDNGRFAPALAAGIPKNDLRARALYREEKSDLQAS